MKTQLISIGKRCDGQARRFSRWRFAPALVCLVLLALGLATVSSRAQDGGVGGSDAPQGGWGAAFTYQGRLTDGGNPANGVYDFRFRLFDVSTGGTAIGVTTVENKYVDDGLFTVQLGFGPGMFKDEPRYLEIGVRPGDSTSSFTFLTPRQELTMAPYALALPGLWTQPNSISSNVIGGYRDNFVAADIYGAVIGGGGSSGLPNQVTQHYGTVSGGQFNTASGIYGAVGGGFDNTAGGYSSTVGGGELNTANGYGNTIGGGGSNSTSSGSYATIGGGYNNTATGYAATVPGGSSNVASGNYSFAAGYRAKATHDGAIILSDSNPFDFSSLGTNNFRVRATNGIRFVVGIDGSGAMTWSCALVDGSAWSCSSDRNQKENLVPVDGALVLQQLEGMPIYTWNGKGQDPGVHHMGPTAQDFYAAYGLGEGDTHIATIDLDGVALAAVRELHARNQALQEEVSSYKEESAAQQEQIDDLEARLAALEQGTVSASSATGVPVWLLGGLVAVAAVVVVTRHRGGLLLRRGGWR